MDIEFIGEHLFFGYAGNFLIALAFASALISALFYFFSTRPGYEDLHFLRLGRYAYYVHSFSILSIIGIIFYLMLNSYYEYYYVWQHTSSIMPKKFVFAAFWEGQEGSFLLWMFWHVVLALVLVRMAGTWEAPVVSIIALVQVFLVSMILGIYVGDLKIGTNPFVLLREHPEMMKLPFASMPDYLLRMEDGRGLNPLLQNYWMIIHPPTLFLGFAATVVPFAFALSGLYTGRIKEWVIPALPWTLFAVMILGTGILMGAAWAYEALSFGGFWAWDPVENASLVPWIVIVGGLHVMLLHKNKGTYLTTAMMLVVLSFILVLYSTFLTRSGILGDSSVHAFTDLGMTGQLVIYMAFFALLAAGLIIYRRKMLKNEQHDENIYSREFWMFVGVLVLLVSSFQITFSTSIPVINKLFGTNMAPPVDAIRHYNSWQIPVAIVLCILIAVGQFFRYRKSDPKIIFRNLILSFAIATVSTILAVVFRGFTHGSYYLLFFASIFAFVANLDYLVRVMRGNIKLSGSAVAHMGIALLLLGSLISNANSKIISRNTTSVDLGREFPNEENILLRLGDTLAMGKYYITYAGQEKQGVNIYYDVQYFKWDNKAHQLSKAFTLRPVVQTNPRMGNVAEPATKHFLSKDIYTHVTYAELEEDTTDASGFQPDKLFEMQVNDTIYASNSYSILKFLNTNVREEDLDLAADDIAVAAVFEVSDLKGKKFWVNPVFVIQDRVAFSIPKEVEELGLRFTFTKVNPETGKLEIKLAEKTENKREFIILKAIEFPYINIIWTGCILMVAGTCIAMTRRFKLSK